MTHAVSKITVNEMTHDQLVLINNLKTLLDFRSGYINIDGYDIYFIHIYIYIMYILRIPLLWPLINFNECEYNLIKADNFLLLAVKLFLSNIGLLNFCMYIITRFVQLLSSILVVHRAIFLGLCIEVIVYV